MWQDRASAEQFAAIFNGEKAEQLLSSESWKEAFAYVQWDIYTRWAESLPEDNEVRDTLYLQITGMRALEQHLRQMASKAERTKERLEQKGKHGSRI